jgi:hypothetical protein
MFVGIEFGVKEDTHVLNTAGECNGSTRKLIVITEKY